MLSALLPTGTAILGLAAGLLAPMVSSTLDGRKRRADNQRVQCDEILTLFQGVDVVRALTEPSSVVRRSLMLRAVRIQDDRARQACHDLVEYAVGQNVRDDELLDRWSTMIHEVARVYRSIS
ncbi:hypothetical protein ACFY0F_01795 [Streptomyces sp. NPDC001544]|jgi:hypothetical protein|uniref:hypothetical protein n=1 Tax=Streptomyces sp. NPDC001544 TaxID=3364584 RepID=UPI00368683A3